MKKVGVIYFILAILCTILVVAPDYVNKIEINKINKEKEYYIENIKKRCFTTKTLEENYKKDITKLNHDKEEELEKELLDCNKKLTEGYSFNLERLRINDLSNKDKITEYIDNLNNEKEKLGSFKVSLDEIKELDLDIYYKYIDKYNNLIESSITNLNYLNDNKTVWNQEDNKLVFIKRAKFNEYQELEKSQSLITTGGELVKDITGPVITASNMSITVGNKIDIKSKVKCYDEVDDNVECVISGSYDTNKVGTYNITIEATDLSGNKSSKTVKLYVNEKGRPVVASTGKPYYIEVIRNQNTVIVYGLDANNNYTKIVKVFVCSVGRNNWTPVGTFKTTKGATWGSLIGNVYGQYSTRITGSILFHSVPYYQRDKGALEWEEYNKLGTAASAGCVRMTVRDVKWIFDNCPSGTTVKIYDGNLPSGVSKPSAQKIDGSNPNRGWDPTDPDPNNPWRK